MRFVIRHWTKILNFVSIVSLKKSNILKTLGPGILFASTCIGVSHLVQSTQAGAKMGLGLLWIVIIANLLKYPFFEFGSRYANATGTSIIDGYKRIGKWALGLYFLITICTMFLVTAAVGKVTAGFLQYLFGFSNGDVVIIGLFLVCVIILFFGQFKVLDKLIKSIGILLLISTLVAFVAVLIKGPESNVSLLDNGWIGDAAFLIPLMGWMPTAVDLSAWNSLWTVERIMETGYHPSLKETLFDFNFGYITSSVLALVFVVLGAFLMYGTSYEIPPSGVAFSADVVSMYTSAIGDWSIWIISVATFSIMFGTAIAVIDGYGRAISKTISLMSEKTKTINLYQICIVVCGAGSLLLIYMFQGKEFKILVNIATTASFIVAPVIAVLNTVLVAKKYIGDKAPPLWLRLLSYVGILFLTGFTLWFLFR